MGMWGTTGCDIMVICWVIVGKIVGKIGRVGDGNTVMVMKVENCHGSVVLYKVKGRGVHDSSFSEHWGPI